MVRVGEEQTKEGGWEDLYQKSKRKARQINCEWKELTSLTHSPCMSIALVRVHCTKESSHPRDTGPYHALCLPHEGTEPCLRHRSDEGSSKGKG